jgi:hypothetical protein
MRTPHDNKITRCPKLGDEMTFAYCFQEAGNLPCGRIITCWQAVFDIKAVLKEYLSSTEWERFYRQAPKDKVTSLIEIIEQTKRQS